MLLMYSACFVGKEMGIDKPAVLNIDAVAGNKNEITDEVLEKAVSNILDKI